MTDQRTGQIKRYRPLKWAGLALLVVATHSVWLWGLRFSWIEPNDASATTTRWQLLSTCEGGIPDGLEQVLALRSPTVFALPFDEGFSQALGEQSVRVRPPVDQPPDLALSLTRSTLALEDYLAVPLPTWSDLRWYRIPLSLEPLEVPSLASGIDIGPVESTPLSVRVIEGPERSAEFLEWRGNEPQSATAAWTAELMVSVNPVGSVQQVLLDRRTAEETINQELLRMAYQWRWEPTSSSDWFRVRVERRMDRAYGSIVEPEL